jgi:hyperosmotically inducible periplasmic protein
MNKSLLTMTATSALLATLALSGCNKQPSDPTTSGNDVVSQTEKKTKELGADAAKGADQAKDAARNMAQDAKQAGQNASNQIADKVSDAVITTSVKAELVKDPGLSALAINVDTDAGRVILQGTAPSSQAREQAQKLAQAVKGVVSVDNQLKVEPGKS